MSDEISLVERRRRQLHQEILDFTGHPAFYQAPTSPNLNLTYPCTIYKLQTIENDSADDMNYILKRRYQITYVTKDPCDPLIDEYLLAFKQIRHSNHFTSDNLHHHIYDLIY